MHECACLRERGAQTHTSPHTQKQALRLHFQADVPPFDTEEARRVIMEDLPKPSAAALLEALPALPVAAASLGQVYSQYSRVFFPI